MSAELLLSTPMMSPALIGRLVGNVSGGLTLVISVALAPTPVNLPPPAGRRTRSRTWLPALPEAIRHFTIVPSSGETYSGAGVVPEYWM